MLTLCVSEMWVSDTQRVCSSIKSYGKKNTSKHVKTSKSPLIQVIHISVVNSPDPEASDL